MTHEVAVFLENTWNFQLTEEEMQLSEKEIQTLLAPQILNHLQALTLKDLQINVER